MKDLIRIFIHKWMQTAVFQCRTPNCQSFLRSCTLRQTVLHDCAKTSTLHAFEVQYDFVYSGRKQNDPETKLCYLRCSSLWLWAGGILYLVPAVLSLSHMGFNKVPISSTSSSTKYFTKTGSWKLSVPYTLIWPAERVVDLLHIWWEDSNG